MDGAHNPAGAEALKEAIEEQYPDKRRVLVFTSLQDKDTETVIQLLIRKGDRVFLTEAPTPRTRKPEEIAAMIDEQKIAAVHTAEPSVTNALDAAQKEAKDGDVVIICGSLYILGEAMEWMAKKIGN